MAGTVEEVGEGVTFLKAGEDVFADLSGHGQGAFSDYVCAPEKAFARMPAAVTHEEAACLGHSGILALRAFDRRGGREVKAGDRVLVVGASGNVGPYCIQIAKSRGAHVTGVASAGKLDFVRSLGADEVIDYRATDYTRPAEPYDWIVEVDAHHPTRRWLKALRPGGVQLAFGGPAAYILFGGLAALFSKRLTGKTVGLAFVGAFGEKDVPRLVELVERGDIKPVIDRRFSLGEAAEALRYVDQGMARGKVLVIP
jgi:NADPH:quinone reductase-like Zn-dependent oxidoreductase